MKSIDINVEEALEKTLEISKWPIEINDEFSKYSPIYLAPTGNVIDTVNLYKKDVKTALVMGSQGAFAYELMLKQKGIEEIDCFDKNVLQYLYYELYDAYIKNTVFPNFIGDLTSVKFLNTILLYDDILFSMVKTLGDPARKYWENLTKNYGIRTFRNTRLFRTYHYLELPYLSKLSSVYNEEEFYRLKELLNSKKTKINYHICDIVDIPEEFAGKKYDLIIFGNILQYYKGIPTLNNVTAINSYIKQKLVPLLNDNGEIQLGYDFISASSVSEMIGRDYQHRRRFNSVEIDYEIENAFIPNMVKKYGDMDEYQLSFIPGVFEAENLVLTYKKL